ICTFLAQLCTRQEHRAEFMGGPTWRPEAGNEANSTDRGDQQQQSKDVAADERPSPALRSQEEPRRQTDSQGGKYHACSSPEVGPQVAMIPGPVQAIKTDRTHNDRHPVEPQTPS